MRLHGLAAIVAACFACVSHAAGQHVGDINPSVVPDGDLFRIRTNLNAQGGIIEDARVFEADFGDSGFPEFTSNPGFDALPGTFVPGTRVGFHAPQGLLRFTGNELVPVSSELLEVSFLTLGTTIVGEPNAGFDLAVQSNGGWHRHFSFEIADVSLPLPAAGIYVLPLTLYSTDPDVLESELFWLVFDYGAGQPAQSEATAWIEATLLGSPCPADLDGDGSVGPGDLATLLGAWGSGGPADLDADGSVGPGDLATLLGSWGACS